MSSCSFLKLYYTASVIKSKWNNLSVNYVFICICLFKIKINQPINHQSLVWINSKDFKTLTFILNYLLKTDRKVFCLWRFEFLGAFRCP